MVCVVLPMVVNVVDDLNHSMECFEAILLSRTDEPCIHVTTSGKLNGCGIFFCRVLPGSLVPVIACMDLSVPCLFANSLLLRDFFKVPKLNEIDVGTVGSTSVTAMHTVMVLKTLLCRVIGLIASLYCTCLSPHIQLRRRGWANARGLLEVLRRTCVQF